MTDIPLRVGLIGCGEWARWHMDIMPHLPELRVRAYADTYEAAAQAFPRQYGGDYATADPQRVFDDPDIDFVMICTWHHTHRPLSVAAAGGALTHPASPLVDTLAASVTFADGSIAGIVVADARPAPFTSKFFVETFGIQRSATLHARCHSLTTADDGKVQTHTINDLDEMGRINPEGMVQQLREFACSLRTGRPSALSAGPREGFRATALALAAVKAACTGQPQAIPEPSRSIFHDH